MPQPPSDPRTFQVLDDLAGYLRELRAAAGGTPFRAIRAGIRDLHRQRSAPEEPPSLSALHGYFQNGRTRMDPGTVLDIARVLGLGPDGLQALDQACRRVLDRANRALIVATRDAVPAPTAHFTGRRAERDRIGALVAAAHAAGRAAVVAVEGMPGIGKTELVHQAARDLADAGRTDGTHLYADLRGHDPLDPPAAPDAVVRGFLRHLGVPGRRIDALTPAARAALLHAELAPRRALLVLDNAADAAQLRPLLPRGPGATALITSRRRLADLDADRLHLDAVDLEAALDLLRRHDPTGRLDRAPREAAALVDLCRHLPLDLAALGRQLAGKPDWDLADHVERLRRIPPHEHSGPALALSYDGLPAPAQRLFRLLAVHPGHRITPAGAAALAAGAVPDVPAALARLYDESLLLRRGDGPYEFHDTVRAYATDLAHREDPASRQRAAIGRLLRHYRDRLADPANAWLEAERDELLACLHLGGHDDAVADLARLLNRRLRLLGHYGDARICNRQLLRLAHRTGNLAWEADALAGLAEIDRLTGRFRTATAGFEEALRLRRLTGDRAGEADALRGLAQTASNHDYPTAARRYRAALRIHRDLGNRTGEAETLWGLAEIAMSLGRHTEAATHAAAVAAICRGIGNRVGEAYGLRALGDVAAARGRLDDARAHYRRSLALCRRTGNRRGAANAWRGLADTALRAGRLDRSERLHRRALDGSRAIGDIAGEADALRGLAETAAARGDLAAAADRFRRALEIYRSTDDRHGQVHCLEGLARAADRPARARRHRQQALALAEAAGIPLAADLRRALAAPELSTID
ncbi:tetratricopeptide repeat protein [Glycomyces terrestris]|uniref:Tetratricopeptide repeat protein n=1 Tax=Glycomyces terrestris TaxID=2493553 RepID=A0A426UUT1_9ACTN|nr:tetratricopeptide repeat protein [Glycomyces terrestris]RRR98070.1 tetratricopeptide repeat protein [Glycomyces terrestris]